MQDTTSRSETPQDKVAGDGDIDVSIHAEETQWRRTEELATLHALSLDMATVHDSSTLRQQIVEQAVKLLNSSGGCLYLCDLERDEVRLHVDRCGGSQDYSGTVLRYGEGAAGTVAQTGTPLIIDDYRTWPGRASIYEREHSLTAVLGVPMIWQGQVIGVLQVMDDGEKRRFTEADLELLTLYASQAVSALENARLLETERRRRQEAETLSKATAALASTLNIKQVLETILIHLEEVVPYDSASVFLLEGDRLHIEAVRGFSDPGMVVGLNFPADNVLFREAQRSGHPIILDDAQSDPRFEGWGETDYVHAWIGVPLQVRGEVIGYLALDNREVAVYDRSHAALAEAFANQAAIAIDNARLFKDEHTAREQAETLHEVAQVVSGSLELNEILGLILKQLKRVLVFDTTSVILLDDKDEPFLVTGMGYGDEKLISQSASDLLKDSPILRKMAQNHQPLVLPDVRQHPDWVWVKGAEHVRSFLAVPIMAREKMIGALMADSVKTNFFKEADVRTAQTLAQHMAIAIVNARLFEAERTARERAEALRDASSIVGSSLSSEKVLETVLDQLRRVLPYESGSVMLVENDRATIRAWRGYENFIDPDLLNDITFEIATDNSIGKVVRSGESLMIADIQQYPDWQKTMGSGHIRSWLGVPLQTRGKVIGLFSLDRSLPGGFSDEEIALAQTFAVPAAAAIENARLFEVEGLRAAELDAVRRASLSVTASLELHQVLDSIIRSTLSLLPEAVNAHIFLYDPDLDRLKFGAALWAGDAQLRPFSEPRSGGLTHTVAHSGEAIVVPDMHEHPLFENAPEEWKGAIVGLPLRFGQQVVGVMNVSYVEPRDFPEAELRILRLLGDQAAIAIENARLFEHAATERRHLSLLYDVGREMAASLDPDEILDRAVTLTCQALDGLVGQAFRYLPDENRLSLCALYGRENISVAELDEKIALKPGVGLAGWVAQERQPVYVPDVTQDRRWLHVPGVDEDVSSALVAPITDGERLLGVLSVLHRQLAAFSDDQVILMQAICREVGLALSNASRYQQIERRLAEITLIQNLAQTFNQRLELQVLLDEVVAQLVQRLGYSQVEIFLLEGDRLYLRAFHGDLPWVEFLPISEGIIGRVARTGQSVFAPEVSSHPDYRPYLGETVAELAVPIVREGKVVGVINIESTQPGQLSVQDQDLLQVLAGQISIALENAVLFDRVLRHAENLEDTVSRRTAELKELFELSQKIGFTLSYGDLLRLLLSHLRNAVRSELVAGCLIIDGYRSFTVETAHPITPAAMEKVRSYGLGVLDEESGAELDSGQIPIDVIMVGDFIEHDSQIEKIASLTHAPILVEQEMVGMLILGNEHTRTFGEEHKRLLLTFANQAASAVQRLRVILAAEQKRLESLVEHLPVGVVLLDDEYRLVVANPLGRTCLSELSPGTEGGPLTRLGSYPMEDLVARHTDPLPVEITLDGPPRRFYEVQVSSMGSPTRQWVLTLREVTQEHDTQARIQMQDRLATVGQLAAGIAHDFNNIMAAILVYADLLSNDPNLQDTNRDRLIIIQEQVQRASSLIRQILDFSRRSVMEQDSLDLLPFIKEFDKMLRRVIPETIRLELSYQSGSYMTKADPTRLQQVFMNLALNARDAMPNGGFLRFELDRLRLVPGEPPPVHDMPPGEWLQISISDTGDGISEEALPHIFEPFFTTKPIGEGTGLGLAQVYGIIRQHDGYIDVQSQVDMGTTFTIYLHALQVAQDEEISQKIHIVMDGIGETVLVVEDDDATLEALRALLENYHYRVLTASNGLEALKCFEQAQDSVSLVVSDVVMPKMGGVALYRVLLERWPELKMLFITGHPLEGESQALLEDGLVHWLQKPFSVRDFSQAIQDLLPEV